MGIRDIIKAFTDPDAEYLLNDTIKIQFQHYDDIKNKYGKEETDHHEILTNLWVQNQYARNNSMTRIPLELNERDATYYQTLGFITVPTLAVMNKEDACTMMGLQFYLLNMQNENPAWLSRSTNTIIKARKTIDDISKKYENIFSNTEELEKAYKRKNPVSTKYMEMLFPGKTIIDIINEYPELQKTIVSNYTGIDINEL